MSNGTDETINAGDPFEDIDTLSSTDILRTNAHDRTDIPYSTDVMMTIANAQARTDTPGSTGIITSADAQARTDTPTALTL